MVEGAIFQQTCAGECRLRAVGKKVEFNGERECLVPAALSLRQCSGSEYGPLRVSSHCKAGGKKKSSRAVTNSSLGSFSSGFGIGSVSSGRIKSIIVRLPSRESETVRVFRLWHWQVGLTRQDGHGHKYCSPGHISGHVPRLRRRLQCCHIGDIRQWTREECHRNGEGTGGSSEGVADFGQGTRQGSQKRNGAKMLSTIKTACLPKLICELTSSVHQDQLSEMERSLLNLIRDTTLGSMAEVPSSYHFAAHMGQLIAGIEGQGCHNFYPTCPLPGTSVLDMMKEVRLR